MFNPIRWTHAKAREAREVLRELDEFAAQERYAKQYAKQQRAQIKPANITITDHRLGECLHPDDIADDGWGGVG
jgi:hypothetical protein